MKSYSTALTVGAAVWSGACLIALVTVLSWAPGGNHWWLFGTWVDRLIVSHRPLLAVAAALPLLVPFALERTRGHALLALIGSLDFLIMSALLEVAAD